MTTPEDRDPSPVEPAPGAPPGEEPAHPQGLVEEIREEIHDVVEQVSEEIHEAVEHVPKPVRWTVRRIVLLVGVALVALIIIVIASALLWLANRTEWVAQEMALIVNQTIATRSDVVLSIDDMRGNPLTGIRLKHPVVRFRDGDLPPVLEAEWLNLRYSSWRILTGGTRPIEAEFIRPTVILARGPDGKIRIPTWKSQAGKKEIRRYEFHLSLREARVLSPALERGVEQLEARSRIWLGDGTRVSLDHLSWQKGPWENPLHELQATLEVRDSLRLRVLKLDSPELKLSATATRAQKGGAYQAEAVIERVRWKWLARVFRNGVFDVPGAARIEAQGVGERRWTGTFKTTLTWNELPAVGDGQFWLGGDTLIVTPMQARTPSGNVAGRFDMIGKRWVLNATAQHVDPRAWKAFKLEGWPQGDLNGAFRLQQNEHHDLGLTADLGPSVLAEWRADAAKVRFDAPDATTDTFAVDFKRGSGAVRLEAGTRSWGWLGTWTARNFPLEAWPDGARSGIRGTLRDGRGEVVSRDGRLDVTGNLSGDRSEWLGGKFERWRLDAVRGTLLPKPDLTARVRLDDVMYLGLHFDSTRTELALGDATARLDSLRAWAGDTLIRMQGVAGWQEGGGWDMRLDSAEASSGQFHWIAEPPVVFHGDPHGVDFERVIARDSASTFEARGRWAGPGGAYSFEGKGTGLALRRLGFPVDWGLGGTADATLRVHGMNGDPRWELEARVAHPEEFGYWADSATVSLAGGPGRLDVRQLELQARGGKLDASGRFERMAHAWPDSLSGPRILAWLAEAGAWDGLAHADRVPLEWVDLMLPKTDGWSGALTGDLTIGGRPADPELKANLAVTPFSYKDFKMDRVSMDATLSERQLRVARFDLTRGGIASSVHGTMPLDLALGRKPVVPEQAMSWDARISNGDLNILPALVPQIGTSNGRFEMDATVGGTPQHPRLKGGVTVRDGTLRLAAREEVVDHLNATLHFDEARVTLDSLTARQGRDGRVSANGVIDLKGMGLRGYRFNLSVRDFTATETGLYAAVFDGDFVVTHGPPVRGTRMPQVTGNVNLRRAAVLFDFANQSETQQLAASTQPLFWTYRINLNASRNLHWQPPDGDIEFSADLLLEQTSDSLLIYGDLRGERGTYYFLSNRFTVRRADLTFDNESGVNPQLDIEAVARVVPTQDTGELVSSSTEARPHNVTARITGRAAEPEVSFTSDPSDWDEPKILRELTVGRFYDPRQGVSQLGDPLDHYLTRAVNRTMSAEVSRAFRGYINEWAIEREQGGLLRGQGNVLMGVGTQLTQNLSLRYREAIPGLGRPVTTAATGDVGNLFQRQVEAEYRLNRFFYLNTELAQRRLGATPSTSTTGTDFNVNLKARWEY